MYITGYKILKKIFVVLIVVAAVVGIAALQSINTKATDESIVRVKLSVGTPTTLDFSLHGNYGIDEDPSLRLGSGSYTAKVDGGVIKLFCGPTLLYAGQNVYIREKTPEAGDLNYASIKTTTYGTRNYLGDVRLLLDGSHIDLINHIYLEYYLYGVVPHEMSNTWPIEALKTQAVAARTYAVRYMGGGTYDMVDTPANQAYKGYDPSKTNAIAAVDATAKTVLVCDGKLVPTYYAASNGGQVDIPQHVWSSTAAVMPYHVISEDPYDIANDWSLQEALVFPKTVSETEQIAHLTRDSGDMVAGSSTYAANAERYLKISALPEVAAKGYVAGVSGDLEIVGVGSIIPHTHEGNHGKVNDYTGENPCICYERADVTLTVLAMRESTPEEYELTEQEMTQEAVTVTVDIDLHELDKVGGLYRAFGISSLRLFTVEETETSWIIYHRRYGHGIGMSQRGAQERAKAGQTYQQILSFYYPGTGFAVLNISPPELTAPPEVQDTSNATVINCTSYVNVRSTPNTDYAPLGRALLGARLTVTQPYVTETWHQIDYGGVAAYVYAYYVKLDPEPTPTATPEPTPTATPEPTPTATPEPTPTATPEPTPTATPEPTPTATPEPTPTATPEPTPPEPDEPAIICNATVWVNTLNIRSGPGVSYEVRGQFHKNDTAYIVDKEPVKDWHQIWYNGAVAYVYADFVKILDHPDVTAQGVVTASVLNIRSGPGTEYSKLGRFSKSNTVDIIKQNYTQDWHQILYEGEVAYVHADYVRVGDSSGGTAVYARVNAGVLNLRSGPGLGYQVLDTLERNEVVQVLEQGDEWHKVKVGGRTGYMYAAYLKIDSATYGRVTGSVLNVRSGASTGTRILGQLQRDDVVEIVELGGSWHKIRYRSTTAYVYAKYVEVIP